MIINGTSTVDYSNIVNEQYSDAVVKAVERVNTGLKINSTSDDSAAAVISISLGAKSSSLLQGIENANEGLGLISVSNKAISQQEEILNLIKERLDFAKSAESSVQPALRNDIQSLLEKFDDIASSTSYNNNYTLQRSSSDTGESLSVALTFSDETSVLTEAIQSNTQGLNLTNLKNLSSEEYTYDNILTQYSNVESALETLDTYKENFQLTQNEIQISINSLTNVQEGNEASKEYLTKANIDQEQAIIDQYNRLVESSKYAIVQANTNQERVLQLLTEIPEYTPTDNTNNNIPTSKEDEINYNKEENNSYTYESKTNNNSQNRENKLNSFLVDDT